MDKSSSEIIYQRYIFQTNLIHFIAGSIPFLSENLLRPDSLNSFFCTDFFQPFSDVAAPPGKNDTSAYTDVSISNPALTWGNIAHKKELKKQGVFYTPQIIAKYIVKNSLPKDVKPLILDPACGSGIFLLEAAGLILKNVKNIEDKYRIIKQSIFGIDIDPLSVEVCKILLNCLLLKNEVSPPGFSTDLKNNIICGNSLLEPYDCPDIANTINWQEAFPQAGSGFNCIIGNPPYGLKRAEQLSEKENQALLKKYTSSRRGKINKYLAFMANCYDHLADRGVLSFIVPNAWLGTDSGIPLRKRVLAEGSLHEIVTFKKSVFKNVGVETVIFKIVKGCPAKEIKIFQAESKDSIPSQPAFSVPHQICLKYLNDRIPTVSFPGAAKILSGISGLPTLNSFGFTSLIALQAYAKGKGTPAQSAGDVKNHIFHTKYATGPDCIPYLEGSDIKRYAHKWSGQYLRYGSFLAEPQPLERYTVPRLVLREILAPIPYLIQATYLDESFLYNKSVLHILHKNNDKTSLLALLAILNSKSASLILLLTGRKSQRSLFPKLVNADLKFFPLPNNFNEIKNDLATLVSERLKTTDNPDKVEEKIETMILKAYNFNENIFDI